MAIAVFDYTAWSARYPELAGAVDQTLATALFAEAGLYLDNTDLSPVQDVSTRLVLLNMLVAHLAALGGALDGGSPSGIVGRVTSATEGTVSVQADTGIEAGTAEWYALTNYGFGFWAATKRYRSMRYRPARQPVFEPARWALWRR